MVINKSKEHTPQGSQEVLQSPRKDRNSMQVQSKVTKEKEGEDPIKVELKTLE